LFRALLLILVLAGAPLALLAWLVWPRSELPRLNVIALDQVARPDETVGMESWLIPQDPRVAVGDLGGLEVSFEALTLPALPGGPPRQIMTRSDSNGHTTARWQAPAGEEIDEFKVSHAALRQRYRTEDRARLFVWQTETPIFLVEVAAVADSGPGVWRANHLGDIQARDSTDQALKAVHAKRYQVIYVAAGAATSMEYRLMRAWVETKAQPDGPFPEGPVLGQLPMQGAAPAARDWAERVAETRRRWRGSFAAVVKDPQLAEVLRDAGATTYVLTEAGEVPRGTTPLARWADLAPF